MYEYAFDADLARFAIIIGLFIALILYEKYKISPGGMIVPGYIALFINHHPFSCHLHLFLSNF